MKDRQPLKPGQITIALDESSAALLRVPAGTLLRGVMARDDDPVEPGHPLNKHTLLKDATAKMLGGDPDTMVPDDAIQMLAALAASGGGSGDVGELEDYTLDVASFTNAGAGWNTYSFPAGLFEAPPIVVAAPVSFDGMVAVQNVTAQSMQYCVRTLAGATTATAVKINYLAVEYGGER